MSKNTDQPHSSPEHASPEHDRPVTKLPMADHAFYGTAYELFERCSQADWPAVVQIVRTMTHKSLGFGYFALAVTLKKLYWSLVPRLDEAQARKYVFRVVWTLARAKRENSDASLIHRNPDRFKLRKSGEKSTYFVKLHNFDPDLVMPAKHEWNTMLPDFAAMMTVSANEDDQDFEPSHANHHAIKPSPHIMFAGTSKAKEQ